MRPAAMAALCAAAMAGCGGGTDRPARGEAPQREGAWDVVTSGPRTDVQFLRAPRVAFTPAGAALVTLHGASFEGSSCVTRHAEPAFVTTLAADGTLAPLRRLPGRVRGRPVARPDGGATALVTDPTRGSTDCAPTDRLSLADLRPDATVATRRVLAPRVDDVWDAALAAGRDGTVAAMWIEVAAETTSTLRVLVRAPDGTVSGPVTVDRGDGVTPQGPWIPDADVAVTADGEILVVHADPGTVRATTLDGAGRIVRREALGRTDAITQVAVATGVRGRAAAVWSTQDGGEEREAPYRVFAATRVAGARGFRPRETLDDGAAIESGSGTLAVGVARDGRAMAAWDNVTTDGSGPVYAAHAPADGGFGRPARLATRAALAAAGLGPDGRAIVVVTDADGTLASLRHGPSATRFGRLEPLTGAAAYEATVAFAPDGREVVAWAEGRERRQRAVIATRRGA